MCEWVCIHMYAYACIHVECECLCTCVGKREGISYPKCICHCLSSTKQTTMPENYFSMLVWSSWIHDISMTCLLLQDGELLQVGERFLFSLCFVMPYSQSLAEWHHYRHHKSWAFPVLALSDFLLLVCNRVNRGKDYHWLPRGFFFITHEPLTASGCPMMPLYLWSWCWRSLQE